MTRSSKHSILYAFAALAASAALALTAGCGGGSGPIANANIAGQPLGVLTTDPLPFTSLEGMTGKTFYLRPDRKTGLKYPSVLLGTDGTTSFRNGVLRTDLIIGGGDSGTPVYDTTGKLAGALSFGWPGNDNLFGMTPVEDMMQAADNEEASRASAFHRSPDNRRSLLGLSMVGLDSGRWDQLSRKNPGLTDRVEAFQRVNINPRSIQLPLGRAPAAPLQPGETFVAMLAEGPDFTAYAYGSATLPYKNRMLCWGHSLGFFGNNQSIPVRRGKFITMVPSPQGTIKHAVPDGSVIGTLTADLEPCVIVDQRVEPDTIPVTYSYTLEGKSWSSGMENAYHIARMDLITTELFAIIGPITSVAHQLGILDLSGSGDGVVTVYMKDGTSTITEQHSYSSPQVLLDMFSILNFDFPATLLSVKDIARIDIAMTLRHTPSTPPDNGGGNGG